MVEVEIPPTREKLIQQLSNTEEFDIVVIGGGITGAGIIRDATLRGLSVCLLEKGDYASGTSSQSSKMLHGGLRYLMNYEVGLVREAALERGINIELAPHLSKVFPYVLPLYDWSPYPRWMLKLGLYFYNLLAWPRSIGHQKHFNREQMIATYPILNNPRLKGGSYYFDSRTHDSKLTLINVISGTAGGSVALNYFQANSWERKEEGGIVVHATDLETATVHDIHGKVLINASGPWAREVEELGDNFHGDARLHRTKGIHLIVAPKIDEYSLLLVNEDERPIFVVPWGEYNLVGTTDTTWTLPNEEVVSSKEDIDYVLKALNKLFPDANFTYDDVYASFAGVRPLIYEKGKDERATSRNHTIFNYGDVITISGGKLTTYRHMADDVLKVALKNMGLKKSEHKCVTQSIPPWSAEYDNFTQFSQEETQLLTEQYGLSARTAEYLISMYGASLELMHELLADDKLRDHLVPGYPYIKAQIVFAARYEYARRLVDVGRRRFHLMFSKGNGLDVVDTLTELMGAELNWDATTQQQMQNEYVAYVRKYIKPDLE